MTGPGRITVSYFGVNQAYQLALAAQELGELNTFYCSLYDAPGKWGGTLGNFLGHEILVNRRCSGFDDRRAFEIPGPILFDRLKAYLSRTSGENSWVNTSRAFDSKVARRLQSSNGSVFVGVETCARDSFRVATELGMTKVLDCPQVHPSFLTRLVSVAANDLAIESPPLFDPPELVARKAEEFEVADILLTISEVQRRSFVEAGVPSRRLITIPLWADPELWFPPPVLRQVSRSPQLRVLFVGTMGLRKGIHYLIRALDDCGEAVQLTLVGANSRELHSFMKQSRSIRYAGRKSKRQLRQMYWDSDVLVLPSLVDTFGFVAMEAMACGLPVIVTDNCGVPVPDPSWRVPVMDSDSIAERLTLYVQDRDLCREHGLIAAEFARQFTPERYRQNVQKLFCELLGLASS
jgi:glycosyltransferase involved in cell wall biosynthesis